MLSGLWERTVRGKGKNGEGGGDIGRRE